MRFTSSRGRESARSTEPVVPTVIPPIYGLKGVGFETLSADGPISYWNAYVGIGQMGGQGDFPRSARGDLHHADTGPRRPEIAGFAGLSIELAHPEPPKGSFNRQAANRRGVEESGSMARSIGPFWTMPE